MTSVRKIVLGVALASIGLLPTCGHASDLTSRKVHCESGEYRYLLFVPSKSGSIPAIVLLHGAGDRPEPMIEAWKKLAKKENIVLIAPELPRDPKFEPLAPKIFRCIVEDSKQVAPLDPSRIYLFGNSMGGYLTYDAAMLESRYFAAAAIHAMRIADEYTWIVARASRKTPVAIYIGDQDQFIPIDGIRKTRDLLLKEGFSVHYVELKKHDHNYYDLSDQINADAWNFLKEVRLLSN
jgi:poly(3-hydroxybutyrate) depolymerase